MKLKVKKLHEKAILPRKAHASDACFDLYAVSKNEGVVAASWVYSTGIAIEIPDGFYGQILTRSSMAELGLVVVGGVIDAGYRGEIKIVINVLKMDEFALSDEMNDIMDEYIVDKPVAQLAILPVPEFELVEVQELAPSDRGENGFGSTDAKP